MPSGLLPGPAKNGAGDVGSAVEDGETGLEDEGRLDVFGEDA